MNAFRLREAIVCERRHEYVIFVANHERGMSLSYDGEH